ncbi:uncharacterized protein BDW43DRAFT_39693 [Aspergillus alliaceus]|uniref:uncharacterized protein n=1 Tax=Petromyces alliaceus TaxID=209559 RepID=UPI0012A5F752|nr:uncharacterized protein BDW43DRAFT_39693 [Aspergillus alliaceus]KAB8235112.1 hypothetical protein BDW43DRAFT_39693 [Aspergillus alliaceus]
MVSAPSRAAVQTGWIVMEPDSSILPATQDLPICRIIVVGPELKGGDEVFIQLHLAENLHPKALCIRWDPASRFAISIRERDIYREFHTFLTTEGILNIMKTDSLVDVLDGYTLEESQLLQRRCMGKIWLFVIDSRGKRCIPKHISI